MSVSENSFNVFLARSIRLRIIVLALSKRREEDEEVCLFVVDVVTRYPSSSCNNNRL